MYGAGSGAVGAVGAVGGAGGLAMTGFNTFFLVLTGIALVMAGVLITRLVPRREF